MFIFTVGLLCGKFIRNTIYQTLSESTKFLHKTRQKHCGLLFFWHSVLHAKFRSGGGRRSSDFCGFESTAGQICSPRTHAARAAAVRWKSQVEAENRSNRDAMKLSAFSLRCYSVFVFLLIIRLLVPVCCSRPLTSDHQPPLVHSLIRTDNKICVIKVAHN